MLSVSGVPPTTAVVGNRGRQWGGVCEVTTVVGWWILKHKVGEGIGSKTQNQAVMAQFQAHHVKWQCRIVRWGGMVGCIRWW